MSKEAWIAIEHITDGIGWILFVTAIALAYYLRAKIIKYERDNKISHAD